MNNIGYIYKITNKITSKIYIGQTKRTIKQRWSEHKQTCKSSKDPKYDYPLYRAIRKYGIHNFKIEEIEQCSFDNLDEREIYWIKFFDSFHNGYNLTLGGEGGKKLELDEQTVINKYKELKIIENVAKYFSCSSGPIKDILIKNNIDIIKNTYKVFQFDRNRKFVAEYDSLTEAAEHIYHKGQSKTIESAVIGIRKAILCNTFFYEHYWESEDIKDRENKKQKMLLTDKKSTQKRINKETCGKFCPVCGNKMAKNSKLCIDCENKQRKDEAIKAKEQKGITREFLKNEIRTKPFTQIAKEQGVSDNAIRKWCKKYNLPYKSSEIKQYTDEEWKLI